MLNNVFKMRRSPEDKNLNFLLLLPGQTLKDTLLLILDTLI